MTMTERSPLKRRSRLRAGLVVLGAAIVLVVGLLAFRGGGVGTGDSVSPTSFSLPDLDGSGHVSLASLRGKPTVVNFFASWCTACSAELPGFVSEAKALSGRVNFVGVDSLETGDKNAYPNQFHLSDSFTALARDVGGSQGDGLHKALGGGNRMPLTAFYDAKGHLLDIEKSALVPTTTLQKAISMLYGVSS